MTPRAPFKRETFLGATGMMLAAAMLTCVLPGCGTKKKDGQVLARFAGTTITDREFKEKLESLPKQLQQIMIENKKQFLEDMAAEHYLLREAERRKVDELTDVRELVEQARRKILIAKLVELEVEKKIALDPEEASRFYEAHKEEFMTPPLLKASHILVKTREEAEAVAAELGAGADFEELARKRSMDATAMRGGDLGFFRKGQFIPEFESQVFEMKKGQISGPMQSRFGFHIVKVTDKMEPMLREFRTVRASIEERLLSEKRSEAFRALVDRLRGKDTVQIDETALETLTLPVPSKGKAS